MLRNRIWNFDICPSRLRDIRWFCCVYLNIRVGKRNGIIRAVSSYEEEFEGEQVDVYESYVMKMYIIVSRRH